MPRVEPSDALRTRIFSSPEYLALIADLDQQAAAGGALTLPSDLSPTDGPFRLTTSAAAPQAERTGHTGAEPTPLRRGALPPWARVALPAAAAVVVALGGGYAALRNATSGGQTTSSGISTIGAPNQTGAPLSAGARVVYERGGTLWSAPELGGYLAQALTPRDVRVAGWAVAPLTGGSGARTIAYLDQTGALHIIRSDGQSDHVVAHATTGTPDANFWSGATGQALSAGLAWSPDGTRLAYLAANANGGTVLHLLQADGTGDHAINASAVNASSSTLSAIATWSVDSQWLAYTQTAGDAQSLWALNLSTSAATQVAAQADPASVGTTVRQIAWAGTTSAPTLTWAAGTTDGLTGVFVARPGGAAQRLSPAGIQLTAADFSSNAGEWLAANGTTIYLASPQSGAWTSADTASAPVSHIVWSPDGAYAALSGGGQVGFWSAERGVLPLTQAASDTAVPVWSPDGQRLAYSTGDRVILLKLYNGGMAGSMVVLQAAGTSAIRWAPDGQSVAVALPSGVLVVASNGSAPHLVDTHTPDGGALAWSVAR
jgi:WD40 repeat protein